MDHLYNSAFRVEEMTLTVLDGQAQMTWAQAVNSDPALNTMLTFLKGRMDLNFVRPGKDIAPAPVAGRAPDRIGVFFTYSYAPIKAGQRLVSIPNEYGAEPVKGTFDIRVIPDEALDYSDAHHLEVQVLEVNQHLDLSNWPSDEDE